MTTRANNSPLEDGQTSIERVKPKLDAKTKTYSLTWRIKLPGVAKPIQKRSKGPTVGITYARARATAQALLSKSADGLWDKNSDLAKYMKKISVPAVENSRLAPRSKDRYLIALKQLQDAFEGHTVASGTRFRTIEKGLQAIAAKHGAESGRQAKNVFSKYVLQQLIRDELIVANPILGMSIDLGDARKSNKPLGAVALSLDEYKQVVSFLLELKPADCLPKVHRGKYPLEVTLNKYKNIINITLLQAGSGLRISEAASRRWGHVTIDKQGMVSVEESPHESKTSKGRVVPILDERIAARIRELKPCGQDVAERLVVGSPADDQKIWDSSNLQKTIRSFYKHIAKATDVKKFQTQRSHIWRATWNTLLANDVPLEVRSAFFGHTKQVNQRYYTDEIDVLPMRQAALKLLASG